MKSGQRTQGAWMRLPGIKPVANRFPASNHMTGLSIEHRQHR